MVVATLTDSHEDPEEFYPDGYAMYADPAYRGDFDGFAGEVVHDEKAAYDLEYNLRYEDAEEARRRDLP